MASDSGPVAEGSDRHISISEEEWKKRTRLPKKLIVCCDGTWMDSDNGWKKGSWGRPGKLQNPSNVTRISRAISFEDDGHHPQIVYYQAGIGSTGGAYNHFVGGGTGLGLSENIREAYAFIASNYAENEKLVDPDSIFLIGFSRGAYTARSVGGFICALGVLKKMAMAHFYELYSDWENAGNPSYEPLFFDRYFERHHDVKKVKPPDALAKDKNQRDKYLEYYFKLLLDLNLSQKVKIKCIGVWDTVGALGIPVTPLLQRLFPFLPSFIHEAEWFDTRLNEQIENAFQALALDERRYPYSPSVWERRNGCKTNLKQVWFPGAHTNVGGSCPDPGTADITLAWMMDQLAGNTIPEGQEFRHHDWIKFDQDYIDHWYDLQWDWYETHNRNLYNAWGRGKVYDSLTFPASLLGQKVRTPGRYHKTDYDTGKANPQDPLQETNEYIHSCVRARIDLAGRAPEPEWSKVIPNGWLIGPLIKYAFARVIGTQPRPYQPQRPDGSLHGWRLDDGHESHRDPNLNIDTSNNAGLNRVKWSWDGKATGKMARNTMPEDTLGKFERILLSKDPELAPQMEFTNNGWRWLPETLRTGIKHQKTI